MAAADLAVQLRQLSVADLDAYRGLHRFGLKEAPHAFVETLANDAARPDATVGAMLARGEGWGAFDSDRLVGKCVIDGLPYDCLAHTRWLHASYLHRTPAAAAWAQRWVGAAIAHVRAQSANARRALGQRRERPGQAHVRAAGLCGDGPCPRRHLRGRGLCG